MLPRDPVITACDHVFCQPCLNSWMTRSESDRQATCPTDRKSLVDVKTGISTVKPIERGSMHHRILGNIRVHCPANKDVCTWAGRYSEADAHADNCPYSVEVCVYCQSKVPKSAFSSHTCVKSQIAKETKARLYVGAWVTYRTSVVFPVQYGCITALGTHSCTVDSDTPVAYEHINTIFPTDPRPEAAPAVGSIPMSVESDTRALCAAIIAYRQDNGTHVPTLAVLRSYWITVGDARRTRSWNALHVWTESALQRWKASYLADVALLHPAPAAAAAGGGGGGSAYSDSKEPADAAGAVGGSARVAAVVARAAAAVFSDSKEEIRRRKAARAAGGGSASVDDVVAARRRRASAGAGGAAAAQSMIDDDDSDDDDGAPSAADEKKAAAHQRKKVAFRVQDNSTHQFPYTEMKAAKAFLMENGYVVVKLPEAILPDDTLLFKYLSTLGTGIEADDDAYALTRKALPGDFGNGIVNGVLYARPGGNSEKGGATKTAPSGVGQSEVAWAVRSHPHTRALFEEFTGEADLRTGFDSINLFVKGVHKTEKSWPHVDVNEHAYQKTAEDAGCSWDVQSIYNTRPTTEGSGGLVVYPASHKHHAAVIARAHAEKSKRNFIKVNKDGNEPLVEGVTPLLVTSDAHTFTFWLSPLIHYAATGKEVHRTRGEGDRILRFGVYVSLSPAKIAEPSDDIRIAMIKKGITTNHAAHDPVVKGRARYARPKWNFEISAENPTRQMIHFTPAMLELVAPKTKWQFIQAGDYSDFKEREPVAAAAASSSSSSAAAAAASASSAPASLRVGYPTAASALQHAMTIHPDHEGDWKTERLPSVFGGGWTARPVTAAAAGDYKAPAAAAAAAGGGGGRQQPNYLRDELPAAAAAAAGGGGGGGGGDYTSSSSGGGGGAAGPRSRRPPTPVPAAAAAAGGGVNRRKRESPPRVEEDDDDDYSEREQDDDFEPEDETKRVSPSQRKRAKREQVYTPAASPVYSPTSPTYSPSSPSTEEVDRTIEAAVADTAREDEFARAARWATPAAAAAAAAPNPAAAAPKPVAIDLTAEPDSCSEYQSGRMGKPFQSCHSCIASASSNCRFFASFFQL